MLFFAQVNILLMLMLVIVCASRILYAFTSNNKSSANAIALVCFFNSKLRELYWIFQNLGPQQATCRHPLLTSPSTTTVFVLIAVVA
jgi:hypothetical protein